MLTVPPMLMVSMSYKHSVTAEVAGSSPVVPAIKSKKTKVLWHPIKVTIANKGPEVSFHASRNICITRLLASRFVAEMALLYTSKAVRELA